jgi:hypothetical protein
MLIEINSIRGQPSAIDYANHRQTELGLLTSDKEQGDFDFVLSTVLLSLMILYFVHYHCFDTIAISMIISNLFRVAET